MLEPQSTFLFALLILIFGGLAWWLVSARRIAFRIVAACLARPGAQRSLTFRTRALTPDHGYLQAACWSAITGRPSTRTPFT